MIAFRHPGILYISSLLYIGLEGTFFRIAFRRLRPRYLLGNLHILLMVIPFTFSNTGPYSKFCQNYSTEYKLGNLRNFHLYSVFVFCLGIFILHILCRFLMPACKLGTFSIMRPASLFPILTCMFF